MNKTNYFRALELDVKPSQRQEGKMLQNLQYIFTDIPKLTWPVRPILSLLCECRLELQPQTFIC